MLRVCVSNVTNDNEDSSLQAVRVNWQQNETCEIKI